MQLVQALRVPVAEGEEVEPAADAMEVTQEAMVAMVSDAAAAASTAADEREVAFVEPFIFDVCIVWSIWRLHGDHSGLGPSLG